MEKNLSLIRRSDGKSMFTDEEFELIRKTFVENNPVLAHDLEAIKERMSEFQEDILEFAENRPDGFKDASIILLQGLNFLARYLSKIGETKAEFLLPDFGTEEEKEENIISSAITGKHCAIFVTSKKTSSFYRSLLRAFSVCVDSNTLRYRFYADARELLKDITKGLVYGVVAFQLNSSYSIEGHLRHDLGHMSEFNHDSAQKYVFPPCLDFTPPHQLPEIFNTMAQLQNGERHPAKQAENFSLKDALPDLVAHMYAPTKRVKVVIVDDILEEMKGMKTILDAWPNIGCFIMLQDSDLIQRPSPDTDILLLDEGMKITGTQIAKHLQHWKFPGLIASTTSGMKPNFTPWHFSAKGQITKNYKMAWEFVFFMNSLLHSNH